MEYYAIFIPDNTSAIPIKSFYNDRAEALAVLKQNKNARMKAFSTSEEAVSFYLHGPSEPVTATPACPLTPIPKNNATKTKFVAPTSQKLVAFRKLIETNNVEEVRATIHQNPRYLISSGDTPTILKEGPRYNALHITAIEGRAEICRMILQAVSSPSYVELLHGQRSSSTDEVSAILLDLYLNTPDKCRSETPLHFASKLGWVEVVRELIAFPQCQIIPNGDGLYAKDIVCSRAKAVNDTEQARVAIGALLQANYFVPVMRTQDNVDPPVIGEPFSPTDPQPVVRDESTTDRMRMRREIRAYAGPMDQDKAQEFCKRWKTPPRLKVLAGGFSKSEGKLAELRSSTPVRVKPRRLFANYSIDMQQQEQNLIDGEGDDWLVARRTTTEQNNNLEPEATEPAVGEKHTSATPDDNGNHLQTSTPHRLFFAYRNLAYDSFMSEDGSLCGDANVSFVCEETQTLYGKDEVTKSPSYTERSIRITDPNKGLETIGRMLATKLRVGWQEYWEFLDTFCNLADASGLAVLETYLAQRAGSSNLKETHDERKEPMRALYDELDMICEKTEKMCLEERHAKSLSSSPPPLQPSAPPKFGRVEMKRSVALSNRYRCLLNSLHVFATRLAKILDRVGWGAAGSAELFVAEIRKLDKMLENYRHDAGFEMVDFGKAHALFACLIVAHTGGPADRRHLSTVVDLTGAAQCVAQFVEQYASTGPPIGGIEPANESEENCRRMWDEHESIPRCDCTPPIGGRGIQERMSQRRDMRANRSAPLETTTTLPPVSVNFTTYRTEKLFNNELNDDTDDGDDDGDNDDEDEDEYYSCSEPESDGDEQMSDAQVDKYFTPPSSPKPARKPIKHLSAVVDHERQETRRIFLHGLVPTREDYAVQTVLRTVEIDPKTYPHVYAWKYAMAKLDESQSSR